MAISSFYKLPLLMPDLQEMSKFQGEIKETIRDWRDIICRDAQEQNAEFLAQNRLKMDRQHERQLEEALNLPANTTNGFSNYFSERISTQILLF